MLHTEMVMMLFLLCMGYWTSETCEKTEEALLHRHRPKISSLENSTRRPQAITVYKPMPLQIGVSKWAVPG